MINGLKQLTGYIKDVSYYIVNKGITYRKVTILLFFPNSVIPQLTAFMYS